MDQQAPLLRKRLLNLQQMQFRDLQRDYFGRYATDPEWKGPATGPSDIVLHLPVLEYYASLCSHVTEFGVRDGHSTVALLSGCRGEVHSYDVDRRPVVGWLEKDTSYGASWHFHRASTVDPSVVVSNTELLFIDTLHTRDHLAKELMLHGRKASRYLIFHDTETCGRTDRSGPNKDAPGILPAIEEFLARFPGEYTERFRTPRNNGLLVLERLT
jgi:cephalosporin hydroxylase